MGSQSEHGTMRAVVWEGNPYEMAVRSVPKPRIQKPEDDIVRVTTAAICRMRQKGVNSASHPSSPFGENPKAPTLSLNQYCSARTVTSVASLANTVQYTIRLLETAVGVFADASSIEMPSVKVWVPKSRVSSRAAGGIGRATAPVRGVCGERMKTSPPASFMRPSVRNSDLNGEAGLEDIAL
ncbi:hypothetical protein Hte_002620 [Hypoxylon texense]